MTTRLPLPAACLALTLLGTVVPAGAAPATIFELAPVAAGHTATYAYGLNNQAQVVGRSVGEVNLGGAVLQQSLPGFWNTPTQPAGGALAGVALPGTLGSDGRATAINDAGQVAGSFGGSAYRWTPSAPGVYGNAPQPLGPLGAGAHTAAAINAQGSVAGHFWKCAAADCSTGNDRAWRWDANGGMQQIGLDNGYWTYAQAINNAGDVLVANTTSSNGRRLQIIDAGGGVTELALSQRVYASGVMMDMNDQRQIAATLDVGDSVPSVRQAVVWSQGAEYALSHLAPSLGGSVAAINNLGWVVGSERLGSSDWVAALWVGTERVFDLNDLLSDDEAELWRLEGATDVNDQGWLTGNGWYRATVNDEYQRRGFLLQLSADFILQFPSPDDLFPPDGGGNPVSLPGTLALASLGLAVLSLRGRRPARRR